MSGFQSELNRALSQFEKFWPGAGRLQPLRPTAYSSL
jgi:hypothetical protein